MISNIVAHFIKRKEKLRGYINFTLLQKSEIYS